MESIRARFDAAKQKLAQARGKTHEPMSAIHCRALKAAVQPFVGSLSQGTADLWICGKALKK